MLKFPYGISDFAKIRTDHYFYVDRTHLFPALEEAGEQLLFLRPRRFGKSLLLSMLENYYDVAKADQFEKLFGALAIGKQPTPKHNQYFVLKWDFSTVRAIGEVPSIQQALYNHINGRIEQFKTYYHDYLSYQIVCNPTDAISSWESVLTAVSETPYRLYLLIDEYDNFANELLMGNLGVQDHRYQALRTGEAVLKTVFSAVKSASSGRGLDRVFITGVSPVVLSDLTSGYNVAENIYLQDQFNDLCGFREAELATVVTQVVKDCQLPQDQVTAVLTTMRTFYNGYSFCYAGQPWVYNPTLALYFLKHFQKECRPPREMLDDNLAMDRTKLAYISQLPKGDLVLLAALSADQSLSVPRLANRFGLEDLLQATKDHSFMASLLYYFGVLTLAGETPLGELQLQIPNLVVRQLYVEQLLERFLPEASLRDDGRDRARHFYSTGDLQPLCEFIEQRYLPVFDNRDYGTANELTIKTAFLTLLFEDVFYIMDSELPLRRGYADLTMIVRPERRGSPLLDFLLEFKYLSLGDVHRKGSKVRQLSQDALKQLPAVQAQLAKAQTQLQTYRQVLQAKYGEVLRLRCYSVVAVGLERVVWEEIQI